MRPSESSDHDLTAQLRSGRDACVSDAALGGTRFGAKVSDLVDQVLTTILGRYDPSLDHLQDNRLDDTKAEPPKATRVGRGNKTGPAVIALGSYARRELCPGSDIDVLLVVPERARFSKAVDWRPLAQRLWYPLWDAGFVTGHGARTVKESIALMGDDLDALTALLDIRHIAGDSNITRELAQAALRAASGRELSALRELASGSELRRRKPGLVAEMLEPNLKDGGGALRDVQALRWANRILGGDSEFDELHNRGALTDADIQVLNEANEELLTLRVALQRTTNSKSDVFALQDQDAVAAALGVASADVLVHDLARRARSVAWIAREAWSFIVEPTSTPNVVATADVAMFGHRLGIPDVEAREMTPELVLSTAVAAAEHDVAIGRRTLHAMQSMPTPQSWSVEARTLFFDLLRQGSRSVEVFEALDHVGVLARLLPEWEHVRSLPQRNAYHHHTVDRHLLEAVSQCATLLDAGALRGPSVPLEAVAARACRRTDLLLLSALLHDIGKGLPGNHAVVGAEISRNVGNRLGLDSEGIEILEWLVRDHLLMAETATRRDLSDSATIERFSKALAGDGERLRLLYLLTIGDSIATGPAAWNKSKAALLRDLFVKAAAVVESDSSDRVIDERRAALAERIGEAAADALLNSMPGSYAMAFDVDVMSTHRDLLRDLARDGVLAIAYDVDSDDKIIVTVAAPDRTGLLATVAGALTCCGLAVETASLFTSDTGMALDVFSTIDTFGRYADAADRVRTMLQSAVSGELDVAAGVEERRRHYQRAGVAHSVEMIIDADASERATVIEVHATDQVGLLYRLAQTFAACGVDVSVAKVATLADRVIDVFYVSRDGHRVEDPELLDDLRQRIESLADASGIAP